MNPKASLNSAIWFWLNMENTLELDFTAFFFDPAIAVLVRNLFEVKENSRDAYGPGNSWNQKESLTFVLNWASVKHR